MADLNALNTSTSEAVAAAGTGNFADLIAFAEKQGIKNAQKAAVTQVVQANNQALKDAAKAAG